MISVADGTVVHLIESVAILEIRARWGHRRFTVSASCRMASALAASPRESSSTEESLTKCSISSVVIPSPGSPWARMSVTTKALLRTWTSWPMSGVELISVNLLTTGRLTRAGQRILIHGKSLTASKVVLATSLPLHLSMPRR